MTTPSRQTRAWLKRGDIIALLVVLVVALVAMVLFKPDTSQGALVAVVRIDGVIVDRIRLIKNAARDFTYKERPYVVLHRDPEGAVAFIRSNCPDKICIHTGKLRALHQMAACLPNAMIVTIEAEPRTTPSSGEVDHVA